MIYEMSRSLEADMRARKFPVTVVYGPELARRDVGAHTGVIVIERDREAPDVLTAPRGAQRNARKLMTFELAARATIFARSQTQGAHIGDHERECERIVRGFLVALHRWAAKERAAPLGFLDMGHVNPEDLTQYAGCAYSVSFRVPTGLEDLEYTPEVDGTAGNPEPTGSPTGVSNSTTLRLPGAPDDPGCGPLP